MAETSLDERFADLGQWAAPTFRPALMPEVARRAGRRRLRRRALVAMGIALAVAVPAAAIALQGRLGGEPIVGPTATPQATAPASPGVPTSKIEFPGGLFPRQRFSVQWVDRDHAWLFANCATALNQGGVAYSPDEGKTWVTTLPQRLDGDMVFSPNGRNAYMSSNTVHWHLSGDTWRQVTLPAGMRHSNSMVPLDDGRLIAGNVLGIGFLSPQGGYTPIPGVLHAEPGEVLPDGTIVLRYQADQPGGGGLYLGITEGTTTNWTMLTY